MDPEVSHAMVALEERLVNRIAGELQATESRILTRVETRIAHEVRAAEERMETRLATELQASEGRMRELITAGDQETRRHMTVLVEALRADFRVATEPLVDLGRRVHSLEDDSPITKQRLDVLELRVTALEVRGRRRPPRRR